MASIRGGSLASAIAIIFIYYARNACAQCPEAGLMLGTGQMVALNLPAACAAVVGDSQVSLTANVTITGKNNSIWDLNFLTSQYILMPGATVTIQNVVLSNTSLSRALNQPFLLPSIFTLPAASNSTLPAAQVVLNSVTIITTCDYLWVYQQMAKSMAGLIILAQNRTNLLVVQAWSSDVVHAQNVSITCTVPPIQPVAQLGSDAYMIGSAADMINAMVAAQALKPNSTANLFLRSNITFSDLYQHQADVQAWNISINVTVYGSSLVQTVIDWHLLNWVFAMQSLPPNGTGAVGAYLTFSNIFMMNISPVRGLIVPHMGFLPMYAIPFWVVWPRDNNQVQFDNSTFCLSYEEFSYMGFWTAVATIPIYVPSIAAAAAALKSNFQVEVPLKKDQSTNPNIIILSQLLGNGINAVNLSITDQPSAAFTWLQPHTDTPTFSLDPNASFPNVNQVGCYSFDEFTRLLTSLEDNPLDEGIAIILYTNISLANMTWPAAGYQLQNPVYFTGSQVQPSIYVTLDFAMVPAFVSCGAEPYMPLFIYLNLVNMASSVGGNTESFTFTNRSASVVNSTMVIPYAEYKSLHAVAAAGPLNGTDPSLPQLTAIVPITVTDSSLTVQNAMYQDISYTFTNFTYLLPTNVKYPLMYRNTFDPPAPPLASSAPGSSSSLSAGAIAGIAVGCSVGGVLLLVLAVYLYILEKRNGRKSPYSSSGAGPNKDMEVGSAAVDSGPKAESKNSGQQPSAQESIASDVVSHKLPTDELHSVLTNLSAEINDKQLVILDILGQGGFGTVYKGLWKGLTVAVKTITFQDKIVGGDKGQNTALMEAAISASIMHPYVVATYSHDLKPLKVQGFEQMAAAGMVTDWKLYIIQEYCDAGSLRQAVLKRWFLDEQGLKPRMDFILDSALELSSGLAHLHSKNIIHGDLNPNNVLLKNDSKSSRGFVCKLADFGLSIKMTAGQSHISNMRRGTPFYTAPEVVSKGNMTTAADTFSLGVMLWELLHSMMCYKVLPDGGFAPRSIFPSFPKPCPDQFAALATACMAPEPSDRPKMEEVVQVVKAMMKALRQGELVWADSPKKL